MSTLHKSKILRVIALLAILNPGGCSIVQERSDTVIEIRKLKDGVWMHTSYGILSDGTRFPSNGLIVREDKGLVLVDTAWGEPQTVRLLQRIETEIGLPVVKAVVTHSHDDRASGVDVLESRGVKVFAHPLTRSLAIRNGKPIPDNSLHALGGIGQFTRLGSLEVIYPGPAHTVDNLMVWIPGKDVLFGGCAVRAAEFDTVGNIADSDIKSWRKALRYVQERYPNAKIVVPGHGEPGDAGLLQHTFRLVGELLE